MDTRLSERVEPASGAALRYLGGFANEHATEAVPGALPVGQNSPQVPPLGLYAEQISGTAFTAPRRENLRTWMYRVRPSAMHPAFAPAPRANLIAAPVTELDTPPNRLRWDPLPIPETPTDFVDGLVTIAANGDVAAQAGVAAHLYLANRSMAARCFQNNDGELLIVPQQGSLVLRTELGIVEAKPGEIAVVPRGLKFRVELDGPSRGYVCENYGPPFRLPDLGPIGANGLANARDFLAPVAAPDGELDRPTEIVAKFLGRCWRAELPHNPLDVVAWHGNLYPYKYDLARFMVVNTVSFDHPDPSIFTVLTAPSERPGTANVDFVIFPPRWMVAERTFRPPWFHRNVMSELMGLVHGAYDAKAAGFLPGGISLHNCMTAHGPDAATHARASAAELQPHYIGETLAFMFESRLPFRPTRFALTTPALQPGYDKCWDGFARHYGKDA